MRCFEKEWKAKRYIRSLEGNMDHLVACRPRHQMKSKFFLVCFKNWAQSNPRYLARELEDHIKWLPRSFPWRVEFGDEEGMTGGD